MPNLIALCAQIGSLRPDAKELGIDVGILKSGPRNTITDVKGVRVGHLTLWQGEDIRTGVTAVLPHPGNLFQEKVPAGVYVGNGFGKAVGLTQIEELGNIETPILITNTLSIPAVAEGLIEYTLKLKGNEDVRSVNPVVFEINDGFLNDIRGRYVKREHVLETIDKASEGEAEMGAVGAGTGSHCMGFKGGVGTSSRVLPESMGGYTIGVLLVTNFGGILEINGAPVGRELDKFYLSDKLVPEDEGSCIIVIATDAPLDSRNLKRLAKRAVLGLARAGSFVSNGSGDYAIAFSTHPSLVVAHQPETLTREVQLLYTHHLSPLFLAVVEATEEAVYNSLLKATTVKGIDGHTLEAVPVDKVRDICEKYGVLNLHQKLPPWGKK
ncbi:aminopeptidase [candidate division WOR-1 bacterium DG_54_3]|uniref:Aminopeptidase n=1 Tax=candidate division WOR-1 bacterium DG_54_3 TaxID=1703775 RepID=A0A0S7Y209_UNCSA|nr:MAG: aminopeptidase [candidate division WOR-1 bacterium DG_54_3]